jgi:hypothetical protein
MPPLPVFYFFIHKTIVMKMLLASASLSLLFFACSTPVKESIIMPGAYNMLSQTIKGSNIDTSITGAVQLKIYTGEYMMYAEFNPADSGSSFGIGLYDTDKDTVTENVIYSAQDSVKNDEKRSYRLIITKTDSGYKQVIPDMPAANGQSIALTETYASVGTKTKTPLDGVWTELKTYVIKGTDTTRYNTTQYKAYYGGYYIWGHTYSDANKNQTGVGFGSFVMTGTDKLRESCITSSYPSLRGQSIDIDVVMNGEDEFKQTISYKDGTRAVEIYQRMKKQ